MAAVGKIIRPLTYQECLDAGCTEAEAVEYIKAAPPARIVWDRPHTPEIPEPKER